MLQALGDKKGISRYACVHLPMDEALTRVAVGGLELPADLAEGDWRWLTEAELATLGYSTAIS